MVTSVVVPARGLHGQIVTHVPEAASTWSAHRHACCPMYSLQVLHDSGWLANALLCALQTCSRRAPCSVQRARRLAIWHTIDQAFAFTIVSQHGWQLSPALVGCPLHVFCGNKVLLPTGGKS